MRVVFICVTFDTHVWFAFHTCVTYNKQIVDQINTNKCTLSTHVCTKLSTYVTYFQHMCVTKNGCKLEHIVVQRTDRNLLPRVCDLL